MIRSHEHESSLAPPRSFPLTLRAMKTRLLPAVLCVSFLLPVQHLRAASDVTVSTAATSGGTFSGANPDVFTPTANAAVANQISIQTSLNAASAVTINTATGAVTLAGALQVGFANGFEDAIVNGNTFTILSGASLTGTFTRLPNNTRIVFPNELGSVKITYTTTTVVLGDWKPYIRELTWDPGTADAGSQVLTNTSTRAGRHYFHINTQATDIGAWKTRLTVASGEPISICSMARSLKPPRTTLTNPTASVPMALCCAAINTTWGKTGIFWSTPPPTRNGPSSPGVPGCRISARSRGPTGTRTRNTTSANPRSLRAVEM